MLLVILSVLLIPFNSFLCMTILFFFFLPPRIVSLYFHACHVSLFFLLNCSFLVFNFCAWHFSYFSFLISRLFCFIYVHGTSLIFRFFIYSSFISDLCMIPLSTLLISLTLPLIPSVYHHTYLFSVQGTSLTGPSQFCCFLISFWCMAFLLYFLSNSTSLRFISWPSRYLLLNSTAYLFQLISANNILLTFCSSFCKRCI